MNAKEYLKISAINLLFLVAGMVIGVSFISRSAGVYAQSKVQATDGSQVHESTQTKVGRNPDADYVVPATILPSPVFANQIISSHVACDRIEVNGYDIMQLNDATLKLLRKLGASDADIKSVVQLGRVQRPLRVKQDQ
jgi:hypothetical protein